MARQDMRLVEVMILSPEAREAVLGVLDDEGLDYSLNDRSDKPEASAKISFPLPAHGVEPIQERFTEIGIRDSIYTVVYNPEAIVSDRFVNETGPEHVGALAPGRISRRELHSKAADLIPDFVIYVLMTAISSVVATSGVLLESTSVLIGSMVIAPLLGPAMATSVSTVIDDRGLFRRGIDFQLKGLAVSVLVAVIFAWTAKTVGDITVDVRSVLSISQHTSPAFLLVTIAVGSGVAGAIALSTSGSTELVGVMVAAALMPPIGVLGVGVAWMEPVVIVGSLAVITANIAAINLAGITSLWYLGYRPTEWQELKRARGVLLRRAVALLTLIAVTAMVLSRVERGSTLRPFFDVLPLL
ncbi:TIGR00341 family protein [Halobaculum sp. D14]|uniref:TIGR00341 family protein n=1 Tax=unclassified Halobaculum TaxID=2640896 RepID=UPI003EBF24A7